MMPSDHKQHRARFSSIVTSVEPDTPSYDNRTTTNQHFHDPLINSAVATANCTNDEAIARLHQEQLYAQSISNSIQLPQTSSIDMRPIHELEADEAFARRLQEEEYTRKSIIPPHRSYPSRGSSRTAQRGRTIQADAELAAQLQEEEDRKQRQQRFAQPTRVNPTNNRFQIPPPNRNRPQSEIITRNHNHNHDDDSDDDQPNTHGTRNRNNNNIPIHHIFSLFPPHIFGANRGGHSNLEQRTDDFGPNDYENLLELDKSVANKPLTADEINRLPTEKFRRTPAKTAEECTCNICWDEFENDQITRRLPCLHSYHKDCIDKWLKTNSTCPICRISAKQ